MALHLLSDDDVRILRELINERRSRRQNIPLRTQPKRSIQSPDIYIAKPTGSGGIPARSSDEPGEATCQIYQISDETTPAPKIVTATQQIERVFNITTSAISQDYVLVERDKYGRWIAVSGGGGTMDIRSFVLRTELTAGGFAIAQQTIFKENGQCEGTSGFTQKTLCFAKDENEENVFFIVYDRLGELSGWADEESGTYSCGIAWKLADTPTADELCVPEFGDPYSLVRDLWEINRMVCINFYSCPCQDPDTDPCEEGTAG